jgi:hypothetical protein
MGHSTYRGWGELLLPLYSVAAVMLYFKPDTLPTDFDSDLVTTSLVWMVWGIVGILTGVLAVSAFFVAFYLVYSPFYLLYQAKRALGTHFGGPTWVDPREVRFYTCCFFLLVLVAIVTLVSPTAGAVTFVVLSGVAPLLWRIFV